MAKKSEQATKLVLKVVTGQKADGTLSTAQRAFAGMNPALADEDLLSIGTKLGAPFQFTHSCYKGGEKACGICDSCKLRLRGFAEAGVEDPIDYETREI